METIDPRLAAISGRTTSVVRSLNRGQILALLNACEGRNKKDLQELDRIWEEAAKLDAAVTGHLDAVQNDGHRRDVPRFKEFLEQDNNLLQSELQRPESMPYVAASGIAMALPVALSFTTLLQLTSVATLLVSVGVSVLLMAGAVKAIRRKGLAGLNSKFIDPDHAAWNVWTAAIDAAGAVALRVIAGTHGLPEEHFSLLTKAWTDAGLTLDMLTPERP